MTSKRPYIVGFGIAGVDYIAVAPATQPGGHSYIYDYMVQGGGLTGTSIVAASRLGAYAKFLGRIGDDDIGDQVVDSLSAENVDTSDLIRVPGAKSLFSWVLVDSKTAERTIYCRKDQNIECSTDLIALNSIEGADALLLDAHWPEGARIVAKRARELGVPVVSDIKVHYPGITDLLALCDFPVVSESSALRFAETNNHYEALAKIRSFGSKAAVITCGENGAYYADDSGQGHVPAFGVDAVDTTGAGDVFHGAFAVGLTKGWSLRDIVIFSSAVSAIKCKKIGGRAGIPTFDETMEFLIARKIRLDS